MTEIDLPAFLAVAIRPGPPHVERMVAVAAVLAEALRREGMVATLVGGGAIEFYAPGAHTTSDIDLVVEGETRERIDGVFSALGLTRKGRHWVIDDLFVEVPGNWMSDPVTTTKVGPLELRIIRREIVLADRIIGFKHWRVTAYGAQAIALLSALEGILDESLLRERLKAEQAEDALEALRKLSASSEMPIDEETLGSLIRDLNRNERRGTEA